MKPRQDQRLFLSIEQVENKCTDALRNVQLLPSSPEPIRIERFIEKHFKISPQYEDLGENVLGFTQFGSKGVEAIFVSRRLEEATSVPSRRRVQTTLAHEAGHGLFHAHLFLSKPKSGNMFGDFSEPNSPKVLCRESDVGGCKPQYAGNWWEYQANLAIGSFLLPRVLVQQVVEPFLTPEGMLGLKTLDSSWRETLARELAQIFDVNPIVTRIRLDQLFPTASSTQIPL
jgi:hypothetical protein